MKNVLSVRNLFFTTVSVAVLIIGVFTEIKFINHEKILNEKLSRIEQSIYLLLEQKNENIEYVWSETGFNYLAIGNSITKHKINEYWPYRR